MLVVSKMTVYTYCYFINTSKLKGAEAVDRRSDIFTIVRILDTFQLPDAGDISQSGLYLIDVWYLHMTKHNDRKIK